MLTYRPRLNLRKYPEIKGTIITDLVIHQLKKYIFLKIETFVNTLKFFEASGWIPKKSLSYLILFLFTLTPGSIIDLFVKSHELQCLVSFFKTQKQQQRELTLIIPRRINARLRKTGTTAFPETRGKRTDH